MLLDLSELLSGSINTKVYHAVVEMERFDTGAEIYGVKSASEIDITITQTGVKRFLVTGAGNITLVIPCARCLSEVDTYIEYQIEREIDFNAEDELSDERLEEMSYIDGYHLDVDKLVYSEVLIDVPLRVLCSEDCRGLCYKCGANLNRGECGCDRVQLDPRMSVIQDIFKNFKEV
jgi:uncharacterized protein